MRALFRAQSDGWLVVGLRPGRIDLAHVLSPAGSRPRLLRLESYDRQGEDSKALATLRKQGKLGASPCATLLRPGEYQISQVEAPNVPDEELVAAIRWSLKERLDYAVDAATIDVIRIPSDKSSGKPAAVFAVSADNAVLTPVIHAFDEARVKLEVVDIPEMAQRNLATLVADENRGLAMLTFDADGGLLTFTFQGELFFSRRIEMTSDQLATTDADRRASYFDRLGLELQRSLDNFDRMFSFIQVSKVVLGPGAAASELAGFLKDYIYVPAEILDVTAVIDCAAAPELHSPELQAERLLLIGAGLRDAAAGRA